MVPVSDAWIVLLLCGVRELGGVAARSTVRQALHTMARQELESQDIRLVDDAVFTSGRAVLAVLYIDPSTALSALDGDLLRDRLVRTSRQGYENAALAPDPGFRRPRESPVRRISDVLPGKSKVTPDISGILSPSAGPIHEDRFFFGRAARKGGFSRRDFTTMED